MLRLLQIFLRYFSSPRLRHRDLTFNLFVLGANLQHNFGLVAFDLLLDDLEYELLSAGRFQDVCVDLILLLPLFLTVFPEFAESFDRYKLAQPRQ